MCAHALHPTPVKSWGAEVATSAINIGVCQPALMCFTPLSDYPLHHLPHQLVRQAGAGGHERQHHRLAAQQLRRLGALLRGDRAPVQLLQLWEALQDLDTSARSCWLPFCADMHRQANINLRRLLPGI